MNATVIPCKRPKVITVHDRHYDRHGAHCQVYGCTWKYGPGVKTDVEEQASRHRQAHRAAVPVTLLERLEPSGYRASCQCGWIACEKPMTRTDTKASLDHHLSTVHGLVA